MHCPPLLEKILEAIVYANVDAPIALQLTAASAFNVERNIRCLAQLIFQACAILYAPAAEAVLVMRCASVGAHRRRQIAAEIIYRRSLHIEAALSAQASAKLRTTAQNEAVKIVFLLAFTAPPLCAQLPDFLRWRTVLRSSPGR